METYKQRHIQFLLSEIKDSKEALPELSGQELADELEWIAKCEARLLKFSANP